MKATLRFLLTLLLVIGAIVCVIMVKIEPTMSDAELLMMVQVAEDNQKNNNSTTVNTIISTTQNESTSTIIENITNKTDDFNNEETTELENITTKTTVCPHKNTFISTTNATCTSNGKKVTTCEDCNEKIKETTISKLSHRTTTVIIEATCKNKGEIRTVCSVCNTILSTKTTTSGCHTDLTLLKEVDPTPLADGYRIHRCGYCKEEVTVILKFCQNGETNLYIPSVGINCDINLGECNQTNTNNFDVSCDMNFINKNNPLFFGHNTRTFGKLHKLKIGDLIYFTINGKTTVYKVTVSEEGYLIHNNTNIEGKDTGTLCIKPYEKNTLHFFTCYPTIFNYNARWIVLAEKIDM